MRLTALSCSEPYGRDCMPASFGVVSGTRYFRCAPVEEASVSSMGLALPLWRPTFAYAAVAGALGACVVYLGPPGTDRSELPVGLRAAHLTIFAVPSPRPIVAGPDRPSVRAFDNSAIVLDLRRPGTYQLALSYMPYWSAPHGCIFETPNGMVGLTTTRSGIVRLSARFGLKQALDALAGVTSTCSATAPDPRSQSNERRAAREG